jgi:uncharacterized protein
MVKCQFLLTIGGGFLMLIEKFCRGFLQRNHHITGESEFDNTAGARTMDEALTQIKKATQKFRYSFRKIMTGSDLSQKRLPIMEVRSPNPGPVVWLTGCAHGDEVGGIVIIQEIFKMLKKLPLLRGTVYAFPMMNPFGFETTSRTISLSKEDLNRSFPGNKNGTLAERLANLIFTTIRKTMPSIVIDLHNDWRKSIPYANIDPYTGESNRETYEMVKVFAKKSGLIVINEELDSSDSIEWERTLTGSLIMQGIPALTLEMGESYVVNEVNVDYGIKTIWSILAYKEMTEPLEPFTYEIPESIRDRKLRYSHHPVSSSTGIIRFNVAPGDVVKKGQPVAKIISAFGKLQETITAPEAGIVLGYADSSVAYPGVPVMAFGLLDQ